MSLRLWCFSAGSSCCRKIEENLLKLRSAAILMKLNPEINLTHAFSFFLFIVRVVLGKFRFTAHGFDFITFFFLSVYRYCDDIDGQIILKTLLPYLHGLRISKPSAHLWPASRA